MCDNFTMLQGVDITGGVQRRARGIGFAMTNRLRTVLAAAVAFLALISAGCQEAIHVGATNGCAGTIEVRANEVPIADGSTRWHTIEPGNTSDIGLASESAETLYLGLRTEASGNTRLFDVPMASILQPDGGDYDALVTFSGDSCTLVLQEPQ